MSKNYQAFLDERCEKLGTKHNVDGFNMRLACVAGAWKQWAQKKTGAREGDTRGSLTPRVSLSRVPVPSFAYQVQAPVTQASARAVWY